jgi:hypothetical protein
MATSETIIIKEMIQETQNKVKNCNHGNKWNNNNGNDIKKHRIKLRIAIMATSEIIIIMEMIQETQNKVKNCNHGNQWNNNNGNDTRNTE